MGRKQTLQTSSRLEVNAPWQSGLGNASFAR